MAADIDRALAFMHACGANPDEFQRVEFYAGHEALSIDYERALTRIDSRTGLPYDVSGHFLWIGERTRQLDGAHVHFAATIRNPIGVKVGPTAAPDEIVELCEILNPDRVPGRLTLITRMGAGTDPRGPARHRAEGRRQRGTGGLGVRSHARQHAIDRERRTRPASSTTWSTRCKGFFDVHRDLGTIPGGHAHRAHRR